MTAVAGLLFALLAAPSEAEVRGALDRVQAADRYQTEMPKGGARGAPETTRETPRTVERRPRRSREPSDPADLRPVGNALLWLLVIVLGAALAVWLVREIQAKQRARAAVGAAAAPARSGEPAPKAPLPDHEALALRGEFAEAIHAILLHVLGAIGRAHAGMKPAWTSREILALVKLDDAKQAALASLVRLVEVTRFGGAAAREEEYRRALGWLAEIGKRRAA